MCWSAVVATPIGPTSLASLRQRSFRSDLGCAGSPGFRLLELARDADQDVLAPVGGDELHAERQALGRPLQRQADHWLATGIERSSEGYEIAGATHRRHRAVGVVDDRAELER